MLVLSASTPVPIRVMYFRVQKDKEEFQPYTGLSIQDGVSLGESNRHLTAGRADVDTLPVLVGAQTKPIVVDSAVLDDIVSDFSVHDEVLEANALGPEKKRWTCPKSASTCNTSKYASLLAVSCFVFERKCHSFRRPQHCI